MPLGSSPLTRCSSLTSAASWSLVDVASRVKTRFPTFTLV